jgi:hypothetical protein
MSPSILNPQKWQIYKQEDTSFGRYPAAAAAAAIPVPSVAVASIDSVSALASGSDSPLVPASPTGSESSFKKMVRIFWHNSTDDKHMKSEKSFELITDKKSLAVSLSDYLKSAQLYLQTNNKSDTLDFPYIITFNLKQLDFGLGLEAELDIERKQFVGDGSFDLSTFLNKCQEIRIYCGTPVPISAPISSGGRKSRKKTKTGRRKHSKHSRRR